MNICTFNRQQLSADGTRNSATTPSRQRYSQLYSDTTNMSRSIHTTYKDHKGLTKREIDEQFNDPNSDLAALSKKSSLKKKVLKGRKQKKPE